MRQLENHEIENVAGGEGFSHVKGELLTFFLNKWPDNGLSLAKAVDKVKKIDFSSSSKDGTGNTDLFHGRPISDGH